MPFNFENLDVYNKAIDFVNCIYVVTRTFPRDAMFGLTSQIRRAAVSIPSNISEGSARSKREFSHFIDIARGSLFECVTLLEVSCKQGYVSREEYDDFKNQLTDLSKMLSGLKRSIN